MNEEKEIAGCFEGSVTQENTALAMGSGSLPVLATPALAARMEHAAVRALEGRLDAGVTSVGASIQVEHLAPSPVGATIRVRAVLTGFQGRSYDFSIEAHDEAGLIGRAAHRRVAVLSQRLVEKAAARLTSAKE
jgi:fluoroacetyl-CoA thioesterase